MAYVDKHKRVDELFALEYVRCYHLVELLLYGLRALGKSVARKVDKIPFVVDYEVIDEQRLAWSSRCLCKSLVIAEHIDKARLANIGTADEGEFGLCVLRTLAYCSCRYRKFRFLYIHNI